MRCSARKSEHRGATIIEAIITIFVIASGFLILFNVFTLSMRSATASRNLTVAEIIADSTLEEIQAHKYGDKEPYSWSQPIIIASVIQGHRSNIEFNRKIEYDNGSFIGDTDGEYDKITITISWVEGSGLGGSGVTKKYRESTWVRRSLE